MTNITLSEIIQDIHAMDEKLWAYEKKFGLRSDYFNDLYQKGQLRDEDPAETREYTDWAACYDIKRHREKLYADLIRKAMRRYAKPFALRDFADEIKGTTVMLGG
ncbi:MAG: hypothetical protein HUU38_27590 [Anaerolineales bacterium]|nr:hypothetical protein [Anaerolineales bacterium]